MNTKNLGYKIAIGVLGLLIIIMGWVLIKQSRQSRDIIEERKLEIAEEKEIITQQLDSLLLEHNKIKEHFGVMNNELHLKDSIINAKANEIKTLLSVKSELKLVKQKFAQLQQITKGYEKEIDSLHKVNTNLMTENTKIKLDYSIEQQKNLSLQQDKEQLTEKLSDAAVLRAYKITAETFNQRGVDKIRATNKANRTNVIKVCFTVGENQLVKKGYTRFFVRIAKPDNSILTKSNDYVFQFLGQDLQFSCMQTLNYEGDAVDVCTEYRLTDDAESLPKGLYHVNIFTEEREIGQTLFDLK
ncbi:MAG: hypothetical protein ACOXZ9_03100 [Bacteroidales bacterium]|jgi:hypothetical protein